MKVSFHFLTLKKMTKNGSIRSVRASESVKGDRKVNRTKPEAAPPAQTGKVYCPMCTHTVDAEIERRELRTIVRPGQKCPRCTASLDAGYIFRTPRAA
jgi:hypothetical protein